MVLLGLEGRCWSKSEWVSRGMKVLQAAPAAYPYRSAFGDAQMRLPLTEHQREHLRHVREEQLAMWRSGRPQVVDELFVTDEVVRATTL